MFNMCSNIFLSFLILSSTAGFSTANLTQKPSIIYAHEAEKDLELCETSNLKSALFNFESKGGTLIRMDGDTAPFQLEAGDHVFPSCSAGVNRSQTLWNVLRPFSGIIVLHKPHATRQGFDPYNGKKNWKLLKPPHDDDEFFKWAGVERSQRIGFDVFKDFMKKDTASESEFALMANYYDKHYYHPAIDPGTKRVYITFSQNAHVHLHRLAQSNPSLHNVVVLYYPLPDLIAKPIPDSGIAARSVEAFQDFADKIKKYLDFSSVESSEKVSVNIGS